MSKKTKVAKPIVKKQVDITTLMNFKSDNDVDMFSNEYKLSNESNDEIYGQKLINKEIEELEEENESVEGKMQKRAYTEYKLGVIMSTLDNPLYSVHPNDLTFSVS